MEETTLQHDLENEKMPETIEVPKAFFLKIAKKVDDMDKDLKNIHAILEQDKELEQLAPKNETMSVVMRAPKIDIELNFMEVMTYSQIKEKGLEFQKALESLIEQWGIKDVKVTYNKKIR